jgi:hypothetical protein
MDTFKHLLRRILSKSESNELGCAKSKESSKEVCINQKTDHAKAKSSRQGEIRSAIRHGAHKIEVVVELPPGTSPKHLRKFKVPSRMTAGEFTDQLAHHFEVAEGNWRLYGSCDRSVDSSRILSRNTPIKGFSLDQNSGARLYFYPEMRV